MTGRFNWSRIGSRDRMHRQGIEDAKGKMPLGVQLPKIRRKLSKAELRGQAAAAFLAWRAGDLGGAVAVVAVDCLLKKVRHEWGLILIHPPRLVFGEQLGR
jgi:hypothetical protein